jgi:hypothetical protein
MVPLGRLGVNWLTMSGISCLKTKYPLARTERVEV